MTTFRVSNEAQFASALQSATGGDTILMAAGTYSDLDIKNDRRTDVNFSSTVTIRSEDPNNKAVINELWVQGAKNVTIENVTLDYTGKQASGTESYLRGSPFAFKGTTDITLSNVDVKGHLRNGYAVDTGLYVNTSTGFTLKNSTMSEFNMGMNVWKSGDIVLEGNTFEKLNQDGLFLGEIDGIRIEDNFIGDYRSSNPGRLHQDNIQFYTGNGYGPSKDIVIRGNTIESSDHRQGVFIFNELYRDGNASDSARHKNILIEDNYIHTTNTHGITVTHADGVTVRDNTVVLNDDDGRKEIPLINVGLTSKNVEITGNTVASVQGEVDGSWTVEGNSVEGFLPRNHWSGVFKNGQLVKGNIPTPDLQVPGGPSVPADPDTFEFVGSNMNPARPVTFDGIDLTQGHTLRMTGFDDGTFTGKAATADGSGFELTTIKELKEIVYWSDDIVGKARGDDLHLLIDQGRDGVGTFILPDYF